MTTIPDILSAKQVSELRSQKEAIEEKIRKAKEEMTNLENLELDRKVAKQAIDGMNEKLIEGSKNCVIRIDEKRYGAFGLILGKTSKAGISCKYTNHTESRNDDRDVHGEYGLAPVKVNYMLCTFTFPNFEKF